MRLLQRAVETDGSLDHAWFCLAFCYLNGDGVQRSAEEAARLLRIAADMHNPAAQGALGTCYISGIGVEMDFAAAVYWLEQAGRPIFLQHNSIYLFLSSAARRRSCRDETG